jgi:phage terminase large subunit-like protein
MIPRDSLLKWRSKPGVPDAIESIHVKHISGGVSELGFKSYAEGVESFSGTERHWIWLDEECPQSIYAECLMRGMTCDGVVILTFTPLQGLSEVVLQFLPTGKLEEGKQPSETKYVVVASWEDAPHLTDEAKTKLWASIPPYQRDARSKGIPQLGSGAIYPVPESDVIVAPFAIPDHWPRGFGLDTDQGAGFTACVWGARNKDTDTVYIYDCYKRSRAELAIHIEAVKSRGDWIPGVGDAAALIVTQNDAQQIINLYRQAGVNIQLPDKAVEAGIEKTWQLLSGGKLKVFSSCSQWFDEFRVYRRDEKGRIVKQNDHLMDSTRYLCMSGLSRMRTKPQPRRYEPEPHIGIWS